MAWLDLVCGHLKTIDDHNSSINAEKACGITCNLLQNGFGRWVDGVWLPYTGMCSTGRFLIFKCSTFKWPVLFHWTIVTHDNHTIFKWRMFYTGHF